MREAFLVLLSKCECGVYLSINRHRDYYQTVEEYLIDEEDIDPKVMEQMISMNKVYELQFYPDTPIGSYSVYHHDLDLMIAEALTCL